MSTSNYAVPGAMHHIIYFGGAPEWLFDEEAPMPTGYEDSQRWDYASTIVTERISTELGLQSQVVGHAWLSCEEESSLDSYTIFVEGSYIPYDAACDRVDCPATNMAIVREKLVYDSARPYVNMYTDLDIPVSGRSTVAAIVCAEDYDRNTQEWRMFEWRLTKYIYQCQEWLGWPKAKLFVLEPAEGGVGEYGGEYDLKMVDPDN